MEAVDCAIGRFPELLFSVEDPLKNFKKDTYEPAFRAYQEENREIFEAITEAYEASPAPEQLLTDLAEALVSKVNQELAGKKRRQMEEALMNYNMAIVVYVNPALILCNETFGPRLAQEVTARWKANFPKTNLKVSDFETINSGFQKRFCYITTAVCESLGKPDDCYELTLLRNYRDTFLMGSPGGAALVENYYDVAPTIVKHIDQLPKRKEIYAGIWQEYLNPCVKFIEEHKNEQCRGLYQDMVDTLTKRYFHQEDAYHE